MITAVRDHVDPGRAREPSRRPGSSLSTAYQTRGPIDGLELPEQIRAQRIAGRGYTATERLELPPRWDFDASFAFGLSLMVAGIEAMVSERQPRLP